MVMLIIMWEKCCALLERPFIIIMIILARSSNYKLWCKSQVGEDLQKVILGNPSKTSPATVNICAIFLCHLDGDFTKKKYKAKVAKTKEKTSMTANFEGAYDEYQLFLHFNYFSVGPGGPPVEALEALVSGNFGSWWRTRKIIWKSGKGAAFPEYSLYRPDSPIAIVPPRTLCQLSLQA